jgi:enoyl-CoA hydratase
MSELATMTYVVSGRIARITLDRPQRGNGITRNLVTELKFQLRLRAQPAQ